MNNLRKNYGMSRYLHGNIDEMAGIAGYFDGMRNNDTRFAGKPLAKEPHVQTPETAPWWPKKPTKAERRAAERQGRRLPPDEDYL